MCRVSGLGLGLVGHGYGGYVYLYPDIYIHVVLGGE